MFRTVTDRITGLKREEPLELVRRRVAEPVMDDMLAPWYLNMDKSPSAEAQLTQECVAYVTYIAPTAEEREMRHLTIEYIRSIVVGQWNEAVVSVIGSYSTDTYLPNSALELVVKDPTRNNHSKWSRLSQLEEILRKVYRVRFVRRHPLEPIVQMVMGVSGKLINMSPATPSTASEEVTATRLSAFTDQFPSLRSLIYIVRQLVDLNGMSQHDICGIDTTSLGYMIVWVLQMERNNGGGHSDLRSQLFNFLYFYGYVFNWDKHGIAVAGRGRIFKKGRRSSDWRKNMFLVIEDPDDPNDNIAKSVLMAYDLIPIFRWAYESLRSAMNLYTEGDHDSLPFGILGSIIRIIPDVVDSRLHLHNLMKRPLLPELFDHIANDRPYWYEPEMYMKKRKYMKHHPNWRPTSITIPPFKFPVKPMHTSGVEMLINSLPSTVSAGRSGPAGTANVNPGPQPHLRGAIEDAFNLHVAAAPKRKDASTQTDDI